MKDHPAADVLGTIRTLDEMPLDAGGIEEVGVFSANLAEAPGCAVTIAAPVLETGEAAGRVSHVLASVPEWEHCDAPPPATFEWDGTVLRAQVRLPEGTSCYGTGEVPGPLLRTGRWTAFWNTDAWAYGDATPSLYQSHPWVLAVLPDGRARGILADSTDRGLVACATDGVELALEGAPYPVYVLDGKPGDVLAGLGALVGRMQPPPRWALGYHQCRWSYETADEVRAVARELRARKIPCDVIWLDIDHMDRQRVFTWSSERFPDPRGLIDELHADGFRVVAILDPGVAVAGGYDVYEEGLAGDHFLRRADGGLVKARVWPGVCHFPDFTRAETRAWWAGRVRRFVEESGLDGLWNDMNEPAAFRAPGKTLPEDAVHRGMGGGPHRRFHNCYGRLMATATREGLLAARSDELPFVLTRAGDLGTARVAATWTGDNQARWADLRRTIPMVLNLGLSGQPFSGPDLGGFVGEPDAELFVRWFELGAYLPFCRGHGEKEGPRKEPWALGTEAEAHVRAALERRYALLPYIERCFDEAARTGMPVCRPLWMADPGFEPLRSVDDAFLLGPDLLVAPALAPGIVERDVHLPHVEGGWIADAGVGEALAPGHHRVPCPLGTTPVFARAGAPL